MMQTLKDLCHRVRMMLRKRKTVRIVIDQERHQVLTMDLILTKIRKLNS
jgi:hypothetical protein